MGPVVQCDISRVNYEISVQYYTQNHGLLFTSNICNSFLNIKINGKKVKRNVSYRGKKSLVSAVMAGSTIVYNFWDISIFSCSLQFNGPKLAG